MPARPVLVTGFEPYGGRGCNPAYEVMRALDGRIVEGVRVVGRGLPVSFTALKPVIAKLLGEVDPAAVISLGLAPGEAMIRLERIGINVAEFEIADNEGMVVTDCEVTGNGQAARLATLPLRPIEQALLEAAIPVRVSANAGTFLCNACLYWFLEAAESRPVPTPCGFVHVPYLPEQVAKMLAAIGAEKRLEAHQRADIASMELSRIVAAAEIAVRETVRALAS